MGVAVGALAHREYGMQALGAAHGARRIPGAAGAALGPAADGGLRQQVHTEPAVAAAYEPVAVHRFTLVGGGPVAEAHPRPAHRRLALRNSPA